MTGIVFEPLTSTSADASGLLPRLRGASYETAPDGAVAAPLPAMRAFAVADDTGLAAGALPRLRTVALAAAGDFVATTLPRLLGLASGGAEAPSVALMQGALPPLLGAAAGTTTSYGDVAAVLARARSLALEQDGYAAPVLPRLRSVAYELAPPASFVSLMQSAGYMDVVGLTPAGRQYADGLAIGADSAADWIMVRRSLLALSGSAPVALLDALDQVAEVLAFEDVAAVAWNLLYQESLALGDTATPSAGMLVEIAEALALAANGSSVLDGLDVVLAALLLGDGAGYVWPGLVLESIALAGGGAAGLLALDQRHEQIALGATSAGAVTFTMLVPETLALGEAASSTAELLDRIAEGATLLATIHLPDGKYLAWVCNTESRAFTTYRNFPFNSFCELDGHYYGATDEGIYLLEGDDDAGVPIDAHVRGGLMDMGTGRLKRMEALYWGVRTNGQMLLKVVTTSEGGEKTESWYSLDAPPGNVLREGRTKIGKGLKSVYWGFEIANVDGSDFELDRIAWLPMVLDRRI